MKAMIFAAGLGTRLKPLTDTMPKALLPLAGKTLLQWQIERLKEAGITDIVVNVHHLGQQIIDYLEANNGFGCQVRISDESNSLLETGGGLLFAFQEQPTPQEPVLVCNVDILSNIDLKQLIAVHSSNLNALRAEEKNLLATVVVSNRETQRYLLFAGDGSLRGWTNRKTGEFRPAAAENEDLVPMAFSGMQIVTPAFFSELEYTRQEKGDKFSLIDVYLSVVMRDAGVVRAYVPKYYRMMDVGKIDQLAQAEQFAAELSVAE